MMSINKNSLLSCLAFLTAFAVIAGGTPQSTEAATIMHYWDMDTVDGSGVPQDVAGALPTAAEDLPNLTVNQTTYGEAYPGAGSSLITVLGGASSSHLIAETHDGTAATALNFGAGNFAISFWSYNDLAGDGDSKSPSVLDMLAGTDTGIQLAGTGGGDLNLRLDDDASQDVLSSGLGIDWPEDTWAHFAINIDRTTDNAEVFVNGTSALNYSIADLTGAIFPTQDLVFGVHNTGASNGAAQNSGLDDLAFYSGLLSASQASALASSTITPDQIPEPHTFLMAAAAMMIASCSLRSR